jgi:hypothetical protein
LTESTTPIPTGEITPLTDSAAVENILGEHCILSSATVGHFEEHSLTAISSHGDIQRMPSSSAVSDSDDHGLTAISSPSHIQRMPLAALSAMLRNMA